MITWLDQRRASAVPAIKPWWALAFGLSGEKSTIDAFQREAEVNWLARHDSEVHRRTHKYLLVSGLLHQRLTGRFADSAGSLVAYLPIDFKRQCWAGRLDWKWQALAIRPDQLPELVAVGEHLGEISAAAGAATGIPCGLPVIAAAADKACEILGAGAISADVGALSYRHDGHDQHHFATLPGSLALGAALPGGGARPLQRRGADRARLLAGELVQGAVRPPRARKRRSGASSSSSR